MVNQEAVSPHHRFWNSCSNPQTRQTDLKVVQGHPTWGEMTRSIASETNSAIPTMGCPDLDSQGSELQERVRLESHSLKFGSSDYRWSSLDSPGRIPPSSYRSSLLLPWLPKYNNLIFRQKSLSHGGSQSLKTIPRLDQSTVFPCGRIMCLSWHWVYFALRLHF